MAAKPVWLIRDLRDPGHEEGTKLSAACHSSLEEAITQAEADVAGGINVVGIYDAPLGADRQPEGNSLWER
jgi:hypothetical protein